jgi:HD-GYP domain-containing protein (c-di-GMP phosphodiesterase class II)
MLTAALDIKGLVAREEPHMAMPSAETLLDIGIAFTREKDIDKLFETILNAFIGITNCDGGTLYILKDDSLQFQIVINKSLGLRQSGRDVDWPPILLSRQNVCSRAALDKTLINVQNVYASEDFNFSGTKAHDRMAGYKTVSMLTVPMEDDNGDVIGVLQLINAQDENGVAVPFCADCERVLLSVASQAAICLTNRRYAAEVVGLMDSLVRVLSAAIDARSPYTANHTRNMSLYAEKFISWLNQQGEGSFSAESERQLQMSIWLHDIGKLVIPPEVMDKDTRLSDKLGPVMNRVRSFRLQAEIDHLRGSITEGEYTRCVAEIEDARELILASNAAGFLSDEHLSGILELGKLEANGPDGPEPYLTQDELICLSVRKGTLTDEERQIMQSHAVITGRMLGEVGFPKQYRAVPEWAASHHEYLNGKGYPNGHAAGDIPPEVRILTIIDIYDALTAQDRPYKPAMPAEKAFSILTNMAGDGQIDGRLLELFHRSEAWRISN